MAFENTDNQDQGNQTPPANQEPAQNQGTFMVVGDRAFHTQDDVVKKITSADEHIAKIEAENAALAAQVEANANAGVSSEQVNALLDKLGTQENTDQTSQVSTEDLVAQAAQVVRSQMTAEQQAAVDKANMDAAEAAAKEHFGENYNAMVDAKAKELGMSLDKANDLAKTSPHAFKKLFLSDKGTTPPPPSNGGYIPPQNNGDQVESAGNWMKMSDAERMAWQTKFLAENK